jgi:hypothetical protein
MTLSAAWTQLSLDMDSLSQHLRNFAAAKPILNSSIHFSLLDECLLEGLLSRAWQSWGAFCRTCVIDSCVGTVNGAGVAIAPLPQATSEPHVSGAAIVAKQKRNPPYWGAPPNTLLRVEPTWGDVDVLVKIVTRLSPTNAPQLLAAFSSGHASAKALQLIRNGAAHNHAQNFADIQTLRSSYVVFPISHPTQAMFWIDPDSSDFLATQAMESLKDSGEAAIG